MLPLRKIMKFIPKKFLPVAVIAMAVYGYTQGDVPIQDVFHKVMAVINGDETSAPAKTQNITVTEDDSVTIAHSRRASNYGSEPKKGKGAPLMPGMNIPMDSGWLARQEGGAHGGHTMERHVGKSDDYLRRRLSGETGLRPVRRAGSFSDPIIAEATVRMILKMYDKRITGWMSDGDAPDTLALEYKGDRKNITGRSISVGSKTFSKTYGAKVILRRSGSGYGVLTAYPI